MVKYPVSPLLNQFSNFSTIGQWNSSIREAVNHGYAHKALTLFRQMKQNGMEPNNWTFPFLAKACAKISNLKCSQIIHTHVMKSPFWSDIFVQTAMVDMYVKCNQLNDAYNLFVRMSMRDIASWNAILVGFAQSGFLDRVSCLLHDMRFAGIQPDPVTVMGLTRAVLHTKSLKLVKSLHSFSIRIGIDVDVSVANTWIAAYAKCGDLGLAEVVFNEINIDTRTVISWNSMIAGYANFLNFCGAVNSYKCLQHNGFRPDSSTIVSILSSCVQPEALFQGMLIHSHGIKLGCDLDICVVNTLVSMYSKCGDVDSARFLFDRMSDRTCVSWTVMISGYAEKGNMNEALTLFNAMEAAGDKPDLVTMLSLISGCGQIGALELGKWIDNYSISNGLKDNLMVCNAFIDMYAKCGSINDARELFYAIPERSLVSWTTMIAGCALNGEFTEALNLFSQMVELGLKPNHITFLAALQACSHGGLLEKGWEYFDMMTTKYNISPGLDHYSCMADLLGRRGKLKEALEFIHQMPIKPDAGIWGALLGACKVHRNIEIGEYVSYRLFELEPQVAVPYAEMANIYASVGRWDRVAAIRTMMKSNKVRKSPGQSLIQVNGKIHIFTVEHRGHHEGRLIYVMLDSLHLHLKKERSQLSYGAEYELH
jgi:pentatricopeptide repeat protein